MSFQDAKFTLYSYFRSSCATRVRTAAALKGIKLQFEYVNLLKGEQTSEPYISINPSGTVPTLVVEKADGSKIVIHQSTAVLEFFEEAFPDTRRLLPADPVQRAQVRDLFQIMAADLQPKTNLSVIRRVAHFEISPQQWCQEQMPPALKAFETTLKGCAGKFCAGDSISLADVALAPSAEAAVRWGINLAEYPQLNRIYHTIREIPEFAQGDWRHQDDTPPELRA
jgi:maleylacetoacetate isomerase